MHQLRVVEAIAAHKSLLKAAQALGVSQPALTKSLREIEALMGVRLFDRHARGAEANRFGALAAESARRILAEANRLEAELDRAAEQLAGSVAVGALPTAAAGLLPAVVARLQSSHPLMRIQIVENRSEELLAALGRGEIDLVVGRLYDPAVPDDFVRTVLYAEPIALLARADHPVFGLDRADADALRPFPLALPTATQRVSQEIEQFLAALGLEPTDRLRSSSLPLIRELLFATDTITAMPRLMLAGDLLRGAVRALDIPGRAPPRPAGIIARRDRELNPSGRAFVESLRGYLAELDAEADGD